MAWTSLRNVSNDLRSPFSPMSDGNASFSSWNALKPEKMKFDLSRRWRMASVSGTCSMDELSASACVLMKSVTSGSCITSTRSIAPSCR